MVLNIKTKEYPKPKAQKPRAQEAEYVAYPNSGPAIEAALYYGFTPLPAPLTVSREDRQLAKAIDDTEEGDGESCALFPTLEETIALLRYYQEKLESGPQPALIAGEILRGAQHKKGEKRLFLEIVGSAKAIAEALLIQTARALLEEEGYTEMTVGIHSVGDRESAAKFVRELVSYYRKNIAALSPPCRALVRRNPVLLFECPHEKCRLLRDDAPKAIAFLGEESRRHFKEVLEYLETVEIPYRIDSLLVGRSALATETVFTLSAKGPSGEQLLGAGFRYNALARRMGGKRDIPAGGVALSLRETKLEKPRRRLRFRKPRIFFLQLGPEAKLRSLKVIETLRRARIPLYHALARDKLISQLGSAERESVAHTLIMGQKEALEDTVIVRNNATREQETVKIAELPSYIRKLRLG